MELAFNSYERNSEYDKGLRRAHSLSFAWLHSNKGVCTRSSWEISHCRNDDFLVLDILDMYGFHQLTSAKRNFCKPTMRKSVSQNANHD